MLKRLIKLKDKVKEARDINQRSIDRLDEEQKERRELDARLRAMGLEIDIISKGAARQRDDHRRHEGAG